MRYGGGANAGHTLVVDGKKTRAAPDSVGRAAPGKQCVLGQGTVIDPEVLLEEIDAAANSAACSTRKRLIVSERAHVVLPHHCRSTPARAGREARIGTTKRGIGPAYEDKVARRGVRMGDLSRREVRAQARPRTSTAWATGIAALAARRA